ncbi:HtaA domain-containing protein [Nocardiopsis sp. NRRL B-16309]|uniref:HtaA domain-containing protein n=1 Tax=Nocardiopsis sp. NRRL B-16309 TaxID=1519494 RepID=UPI0006AFD609|nr:HtaA domain-containing protein [Nocardiopsis sp. NRRL B-16309]KOX13595.1 Htaa domain-containing protein [Nocardiopsis sp. NRRL B-16309]
MRTIPVRGSATPGPTRRILRALTSSLGAVALGGALVATAPAASAAETVPVTGGSAAWGVKESFRNYVSGIIANGGYAASDGASVLEDGTVDFPTAQGEVSKEDASGHVDFSGTVVFTGHDYGSGAVLEIRISDPRVEFDGDTALVLAEVSSRPFEGVTQTAPAPIVDYGQVPVAELTGAELTVDGDTIGFASTGGTLHADAVEPFAGFYSTGAPMDPVSFGVTVDGDGTGGPEPHDPAVTVTPDTGLDPEGDTVTVDGTGFRPGAGVYVALTAQPRSADSHPADWYGTGVWLRDGAAPDADGAFSTPLDVVGAFEKDGNAYDCVEEQCYVAVFNDHQDLDNRDQDVWVPLSFAAEGDGDGNGNGDGDGDGNGDGDGDGETPEGALTVHSGRADWGVRQSFRDYIEGNIAQGSISTRDGASRNDDGTFAFTDGSGEVDLEAATADLDFTGAVLFEGHAYDGGDPLLYMTVTDPRVELEGDTGVLYADVVSKSLDDEELVTYDDVAVADLDLDGVDYALEDDVLSWDPIPATLTAEGVPAFADFYAEGTELDPLTLTVGVSEDAQVPGGGTGGDGDGDGSGGGGDGDDGDGGLPNTGTALAGLVAAAAVAVITGTVAVVSARKRTRAGTTA